MSGLAEFSRQLRAFNKTVKDDAEKLIRTVALTLEEELVLRTPIDTSRARTNWQLTVGSKPSSEVPFTEGSRGSTASEAYTAAMNAAVKAAAEIKLGKPTYVSNCVHYIVDLNDGTSRQAPRNFVSHAVDVAKIKGAKR